MELEEEKEEDVEVSILKRGRTTEGSRKSFGLLLLFLARTLFPSMQWLGKENFKRGLERKGEGKQGKAHFYRRLGIFKRQTHLAIGTNPPRLPACSLRKDYCAADCFQLLVLPLMMTRQKREGKGDKVLRC